MSRLQTWGMYRNKNPKTGNFERTWYVAREVPIKLRDRLGRRRWVQTTGHTDERHARIVAERLWKAWGREIAEAKALGPGSVMTLENVMVAIEKWRRARCRAASGADHLAHMVRSGVAAYLSAPNYGISHDLSVELPTGGMSSEDYYFARHPEAPRSIETPVAVQIQIAQLIPATEHPNGFAQTEDFDGQMDAAIAEGGGVGAIPESVRAPARMVFATALLEVVEAEEAERRRAAMGLQSRAPNASVRDTIGRPAFQARIGDKKVGEVIDEYERERPGADTLKQYGPIFKALKELVGADTPIRAVTYEKVLEVRRVVSNLPRHATRVYGREVPLVEIADRAAEEERQTLAPNTVRSYIVNLSAVMNYAKNVMRCIDQNPVDGLIPPRDNQTERRAFTRDELDTVFGGLADQREADSAHYWVPAVLTWTGCRANEVCQLRVEEIDTEDGIPFMDLSLFDKTGKRIPGKRLKNRAAVRAVPIHADLIRAGFLDLVARRRQEGSERLFPELTKDANGRYSHEVSRQFGKLCNRVGLPEPSLTLHGLRHGFRNACRAAMLPSEIADGLGGWARKGIGAGYGSIASREEVEENARAMARLTLKGFTLPV